MSVARVLTAIACAATLSYSAVLLAQNHPEAEKIMTDRHENFEKIGGSFKTIRDQLRGDRDIAAVTAAAQTINELAPQVATWFPAGTGPETGIETRALANIWEDQDGFSAAAEKLVTQAGNMLAAAQSGDLDQVAGNVRNLGGACGGCHDNYRTEED